jgi:hypothetical protein
LAAFTQEKVDTTWLKDEFRPVIIEQLLSELPGAERDRRCKIEMSLVALGHLETIERLANQMKAGEECRALEFSAREGSIAALMNVVETGSSQVSEYSGKSDVLGVSTRAQAAAIVVGVIRSSDAFPEMTKRWVSELHISDVSERGKADLARLEKWWRKNEAAIEAEDYSGATWLPQLPGLKQSRPELRPEGGEEQNKRAGAADKGQITTNNADSDSRAVEHRKTLWILAVAGIVGVALWFLARRKGSAKSRSIK